VNADLRAELHDLPDGRFLAVWGQVKRSEETFLAFARIRGIERRARYAEAFTRPKLIVS
jgi:hypothetical protein